jgi:hypothetical protein
MKTLWIAGSDLTPEQRQAAFKHYTNRHTGDHIPCWVRPLSFVDPDGRNLYGTWQHRSYAPSPDYVGDLSWLRAHIFPVVADAAGFSTYKFTPGKQPRKIKL